MKKVFIAVALLTLLGLASLCAAEAPPQPPGGAYALTLQAKTLSEAQPIAGRNVVYSLRGVETGRKTLFSGTTAADGTTTIYVDAGNWILHAEIDLPETRGADYAAALTLNVSRDANQTIYFQRITSAAGAVVDDENASVANALVKVECLQDFYELQALNEETASAARFEAANVLRADASGAFLIKFVPVGACQFTATAGDDNASASQPQLVELKPGEMASVTLQVKRAARTQPAVQALLAAVLVIALVLVAWFAREFLKKKKETQGRETSSHAVGKAAAAAKPKTGEYAVEEKEKLRATKKMRDVMNALNERERAIVETLIAHDGKLKQNKIFRETLIPKTSLARALESLERRNVVRLTPEGNSFLVELTEWFTSK